MEKQKTPEGTFDAPMRDGSPEMTPIKFKGDDAWVQAKIEFYKGIQAMRRARKVQLK